MREFFNRLVNNFGWKFSILLVSAYFGVKGSLYQLVTSGQLPYFKKLLGITGDAYQSYGTVAQTPWAMKAMIGAISDAVPLGGYHKRPYIILSSIFGTIAFILLATLKLGPEHAQLAALMFLGAHLQLAVVDLLCEGKYAEMMVEKPETGSDLVTFVWGLYNVGTFLGSAIAGPVADHFNARVIFYFCIPLAFQIIVPTLLGWLPERQLAREERGIRTEKFRKHSKLFVLVVFMAIGAAVLAVVSLLGSATVQAMYSISSSTVLCVLAYLWLPPMLARANLYMFLANAFYVSIPGAMDYFFTADPKCLPNGPHFDFTYYLTYTALVGALAASVGVFAFQTFLSRGNFRTAFSVTCAVKLAASAFDIIIVKRLNIRWGIPDKAMYLFGDAIIFQVAYMLDFMPAVVLTSKVCPRGMESTVYALLAGFQNFGLGVARSVGVGLIDYLGIKTKEPCNFDNLTKLITIAHIILPLFIIPLVFILIPNAKMTDALLTEEERNGGAGEDGFKEVRESLDDELELYSAEDEEQERKQPGSVVSEESEQHDAGPYSTSRLEEKEQLLTANNRT